VTFAKKDNANRSKLIFPFCAKIKIRNNFSL
jgi:hypothetical protein